jgi:ATP-dependent RNA helicase DOB1
MDDLFAVFEEQPRAPKRKADSDVEMSDGVVPQQPKIQNDDQDELVKDVKDVNVKDEQLANGDSEAPADKRRKVDAEAAPIMTDTFETAESREVAAAQGFAPATDEGPLVLSHNVQHQVALPPDLDYEYIPLSEHKPPAEPARTYPFKLDPFQALSVASIERDESVLVSAHTSAGKTVVAEYAIAQCLKRNQRVIYTSPIKALSNQKYRDFHAEFGDVGLMTGDVTINPTASCLVMTTEILRSMLYRGSEIMREVAWVIFDEIHYMRDKTRGVVWEETIILLPDKVRYVFLSATIPNAFQFAEWIAKIHRQACHVVYTDFRPTPLQNYFFPSGSKGIYLIVDEKGNFKEHNFNQAMASIEASKGADPADWSAKQKGRGKNKKTDTGANPEEKSDIERLIRMIVKKNFHPVIVFNFAKRECEQMAIKTSSMRFNAPDEEAMVNQVFENAVMQLSDEDKNLPQINNLLPLLRRGIGVHHSGLLPILKETIEILFQEGLIKVLFATETFSIGLNMPARTVVFTQVTKWDGVQRRPLTSSEYIQMAGRAGRRGLDERGIVIMMVDDKLEPDVARSVVVGQQDRLNSAFCLGYNMILNLLRIEAVSPEYMLERCFLQFQTSSKLPELERELRALQHERDSLIIPDESTIKEYKDIYDNLMTYQKDHRRVIQHPNHCIKFMKPGRVVQIETPAGTYYGYGVVLDFRQRKEPKKGEPDYPPQECYFIDVLLRIASDSPYTGPGPKSNDQAVPDGLVPPPPGDEGRWEVVPCLLSCVKCITQALMKVPQKVATAQDRQYVANLLSEVLQRFPDGLPNVDPIEGMKIKDESFKKLTRKIEVLESRLYSNPLHNSPLLHELWAQYDAKVAIGERIKAIKREMSKLQSISQLDELKSRKRVLRRLGFINEAEVVQMKARVACEISSTEGHELLLAELLFNRFFNDLTPEVCAAMLSVFIFDEKLEAPDLKEDLAKPFRVIQQHARVIAKVSAESKLDVNEDEYVQSLKWQLVDTVLAWANGRPFSEVWYVFTPPTNSNGCGTYANSC